MNDTYMSDILARLQKGESVEDIAKEMTDAINEANRQYTEEKNTSIQKKREAMIAVFVAIDNLAAVCGAPEFKVGNTVPEEEIDGLIDAFEKTLRSIQGLRSLLAELEEPQAKPRVEENKTCAKDPIEEFLNKYIR